MTGIECKNSGPNHSLRLLGVMCLLFTLMAATARDSRAQTFSTIFSFERDSGYLPTAGLVQGFNGNLYGTTIYGGANGGGTVFQINAMRTPTTLYSFCVQLNCSDGEVPNATLVQTPDSNFYGTTLYGGAKGLGTVFKISPGGTLTTLYSFCSSNYPDCTDGSYPYAGLVQAIDGNLYGTTHGGGTIGDYGTVFKITLAGKLTTLHSFNNYWDGLGPYGGLVQGANGNLYGTTYAGGAHGYGTVFEISPAGTLNTLYAFCLQGGCTDGWGPQAGLVQGSNGSLYGTTYGGGVYNSGTVFQITATGILNTLYSFCSQPACADGAGPMAGLIQGSDGNLYGTTYFAGASGYQAMSGTVFQITPQGKLTTLYLFCPQANCIDGWGPQASLLQATTGQFYGTTVYGGANGEGTLYAVAEGLIPFIATNQQTGKVGSTVIILGNNLTGSTGVSFNGKAASFAVVSATEIKATVPTGATSGKVKVTTPSTVLTSNVTFRVTH